MAGDINNLSQIAVTFNSVILLKHLFKHDYNINEIDDFGRTTYNYLQLYWQTETVEEFLNAGIQEDHNLDESYRLLDKARQNPITNLNESNILDAHNHCYDNMELLFAKQKCVCIYCWKSFESSDIIRWYDSKHGTAECPYCGIDTVIGEISGYELDNKFIETMYNYYFNNEGSTSRHAIINEEKLGLINENQTKSPNFIK